ncbi:hypothetical protein VE03_10312 [Pseudogymnoascus sp. 23342-1-I1]|nr:hypothetical protein VE03_10312 [Pseudogymnoascus sp. 23342-1-I1]
MAIDRIVLSDALTAQVLTTITLGAVSAYAVLRCIYLLYFHPLSKFPGPRIAAVSNVWYGYHWLSGKYPWAIENTLRKYGDVVRIAPNELVFITPQASIDIYSPHQKRLESFVKTNFNDRGKDLGGLIWQQDPVKHREVAKKVFPAFSNRAIRATEPIVHKYMDYFVAKMKEAGDTTDGIELGRWTEWLAMDMSADLSWSEEMGQMRNMKNSLYLDVLLGFNAFTTVIQVFKRFPLLSPFQLFAAPVAKLSSLAAIEQMTRHSVGERIDKRDRTEHNDFFESIMPADSPLPTDQHDLTHLGSVAVQLMFAGFNPMSDWFYSTIYFLLEEAECYKLLTKEIRNAFKGYEDITPGALNSLQYVHACLEESLRLFNSNNTGLPRISPGAVIDGHYIPKGAYVQTSIFALARSPRYFHDPLHFRPQRWLPSDHPLYNPKFAKDELKGFLPFSVGPRQCMGKDIA